MILVGISIEHYLYTFWSDIGQFHGGAANPPWLWKELKLINQNSEVGLMWSDPAKLVNKLFKPGKGRKDFSSRYIRHMDGTREKNS